MCQSKTLPTEKKIPSKVLKILLFSNMLNKITTGNTYLFTSLRGLLLSQLSF